MKPSNMKGAHLVDIKGTHLLANNLKGYGTKSGFDKHNTTHSSRTLWARMH
jgi:hypothetical protein